MLVDRPDSEYDMLRRSLDPLPMLPANFRHASMRSLKDKAHS